MGTLPHQKKYLKENRIVKASSTVTAQDFKGLRAFAETTGKRFYRGIVLYTGEESLPFDPELYAIPVNALWHKRSK